MEDKRNPPRPIPKPKPRSKGPEQQEKILDRDEIAKALDVVEEGGKFPKLFSATTRKKKKEEILAAFAALLVEANRGTLDDAMIIQRLREERDRLKARLKERNARVDSLRRLHPTVVELRSRLASADALAKAVKSEQAMCAALWIDVDKRFQTGHVLTAEERELLLTYVSMSSDVIDTLAAYLKEAKPERCECGADRKACEENRAAHGVHLESGCGN